MRTKTLMLFALLSACVPSSEGTPEPAAPQPSVRFFGKPPAVDQSARIGTSNAAQSFTPTPTPKARKVTFRTKWKAQIGKTHARSTMVYEGGFVVATSDRGVHVLRGVSGESHAFIAAPKGEPVAGAAAERDAVFFTTERGHVHRATSSGELRWSVAAGGNVASAPTLVDVDGDGTLDVLVGTSTGHAVALEGRTGKKLWQTLVGTNGRRGVEGGIGVGDVDGDGKLELVAGGGDGSLAVLRLDGTIAWKVKYPSSIVAPPSIVELDAHGAAEILAAWSDGRVAIFDGKSSEVLWSAQSETDRGDLDAIVAAPVALPGPRVGSIVVATSGNTKSEGLVLFGERERRFRSIEGRVTASPVVMRLDPDSTPDAIVGTLAGDLVAIDATGGRTFLAAIGAPIEASPLLADVDADGVRDLIVVTRDGLVTCFSTGAADRPLVDRYRATFQPVNLGWTFARGREQPKLLDDPKR